MADETTSAAPQAGDAENLQPQAGNTTPEPQAGDGQGEQISLEEAKKLRSEAANLRTRLKNAEARARELDEYKSNAEAEKLSDKEKLEKQLATSQKQHEAYRTQVQERLVRAEIRAQAADLNFADPNDAHRLIEQSELEYDEAGVPANAHEILEKLLKAKPYLQKNVSTRAATTSGGATNPNRSTSTSPQALSWDVISKMTPQDYAARAKEIQEYILANPPKYGRS